MYRSEERPFEVRKGAWTPEEDDLLKKYIAKHGEGKWHQVPQLAGLKRCRKSCRLRWINYLSPKIRRGKFSADEVDYILRLHKLLGNRWSLIAGRLPGRTANDVKNYWNSHLRKKMISRGKEPQHMVITRANILRPQPRTFSKRLLEKPSFQFNCSIDDNNSNNNKNHPIKEENHLCQPAAHMSEEDGNIRWWENLIHENDLLDFNLVSSPVSCWSEADFASNIWGNENHLLEKISLS